MTTTAPVSRNRIPAHRHQRPRLVLVALVLACAEPRPRVIPSVDGPLAIDVVSPTPGTSVPASDSIASWGSVGTGRATLTVNGAAIPVQANGTFSSIFSVPRDTPRVLVFVARRGRDSAVTRVPLDRPTVADTTTDSLAFRERWVRVRRLPSDTADSATQWRPVFARWRPAGEVAIGLPQGIRLRSDAVRGTWIRVRVSPDFLAWIPAVDADTTTSRGPGPLVVGPPTVRATPRDVVVSLPVAHQPVTTVEFGEETLWWTIHDAQWVGGRAPAITAADGAPVRHVVPRDTAPGRVVVELRLAQVPHGWRAQYVAGHLELIIRRPLPRDSTLRGLSVILDPGHPPDGTTGPSRLHEDSVTLAVALAAAERLRAAGATVRLTRIDPRPVSLEARAAIADRADADAFVSIHVNAPGPGRPPEAVAATFAYWQQRNGRVLSRHLQRQVATRLDQEATGAGALGDFAVLRSAWMPAVLVEGTGIVLPEKEALLRTPRGIAAYADGIVEGLRRWRESPWR